MDVVVVVMWLTDCGWWWCSGGVLWLVVGRTPLHVCLSWWCRQVMWFWWWCGWREGDFVSCGDDKKKRVRWFSWWGRWGKCDLVILTYGTQRLVHDVSCKKKKKSWHNFGDADTVNVILWGNWWVFMLSCGDKEKRGGGSIILVMIRMKGIWSRDGNGWDVDEWENSSWCLVVIKKRRVTWFWWWRAPLLTSPCFLFCLFLSFPLFGAASGKLYFTLYSFLLPLICLPCRTEIANSSTACKDKRWN